MYTILVNEMNELVVSVKERIMQRSKLVDSLHFLVDTTYKGMDMSDFTVMMEYVLPVSREYKTEMLVKADELYKGKLEYTLPFDTNLTKEAGNIELQLTFVKVSLDADGNSAQYVRKTGATVVTVIPVTAWSDIIPDNALSALDQRLVKLDAQMHGLNEFASYVINNQVDDLVYNDDECTLQLASGGVGIGRKVSLKDAMDDGIPVVEFGSSGGTSSGDKVDPSDSVVEF